MKRRTGLLLAIGTLLFFGVTARARAQAEHYGPAPIEVNLHAGALILDNKGAAEDDTDPMFGVRLGYNMPSGVGIAGNFDYVPSNADFGGNDVDVNTYLYSGEINYTFSSSSRLHFFVLAGVGAQTTSYNDSDIDSNTDLLIPFGVGGKWFARSNQWGLRAELRDNLVHVSDGGSDNFNNIELSGGVSFFFGS